MRTKEVIDRIFKEPGVQYELTEFENLGKPIHEIISIYPKIITTGKDAGKTKYFLKSFIPFSTGNEEVQVYAEGGKSAPQEINRQLWVYKLIHRYGYTADQIDLEKSLDPRTWYENASGQALMHGLRQAKLTATRIPDQETLTDDDKAWEYFDSLRFDVILANPPFAGEMKDRRMLARYELAKPALKRAGDDKAPKEERDVLFIGDTLLNGTGRGTPGRAVPYLIDEPAVPDNHVAILRSDDLEPVYLSLYLNSSAGQMQTVPNVSMHIRNVYDDRELAPEATIQKYLTVRQDGARAVRRQLDHYNLDMIISVGYRVKSHVATRFRIWAAQRLKECIIKGFVLDDERLKNPDQPFDYFDELTRRIQDISTSKRRFFQKITDIYATSIDYDPTLDISIRFFQTVQNKLHWAITGQTAAEIVYSRADADQPSMALTNWRGAKVRKQDVSTAKNYLDEAELAALNNLVEQYLIFAEGQAMRRIPMHMRDWISKLDAFLNINDREILAHAGRVSHEMAQQRAEGEYEKFRQRRIADGDRTGSDFDKLIERRPAEKEEKPT